MAKPRVYRTDMIRYAQNATQTRSKKTATHAANSNTNITRVAKASGRREASVHRRAERANGEDALVGMNLSATGRVVGAHVTTVSAWGKKGALAAERLTQFLTWRTSGRQSSVRASIMRLMRYGHTEVRRGDRCKDL